jgi:rubrerythrin
LAPDLHPNDSKFRKKATEKTQQINHAKETILAYLSGTYTELRASAEAREAEEEARRAREESERNVREREAREREQARVRAEEARHAEERGRQGWGEPLTHEQIAEQVRNKSKPKLLWACEECGTKSWVPFDAFGKLAKCPYCNQVAKIVTVTIASEPAAEPQERPESRETREPAEKQSIWTRELGSKYEEKLSRWARYCWWLMLLGCLIYTWFISCHSQESRLR